MSITIPNQNHPVAEVCAGSCIGVFLGTHLSQINEVVQIIAGLVAIIAGVTSLFLRYHNRKPREPRE